MGSSSICKPLFFRLTFDTTTFLLFGEKLSSLDSNELADKESEFAQAFNIGQDFLSHRGRLGESYWLTDRVPEFRRACKTSQSLVDSAGKRALEAADERKQSGLRNDNKRYRYRVGSRARPVRLASQPATPSWPPQK
jgi:hypothetical protein